MYMQSKQKPYRSLHKLAPYLITFFAFLLFFAPFSVVEDCVPYESGWGYSLPACTPTTIVDYSQFALVFILSALVSALVIFIFKRYSQKATIILGLLSSVVLLVASIGLAYTQSFEEIKVFQGNYCYPPWESNNCIPSYDDVVRFNSTKFILFCLIYISISTLFIFLYKKYKQNIISVIIKYRYYVVGILFSYLLGRIYLYTNYTLISESLIDNIINSVVIDPYTFTTYTVLALGAIFLVFIATLIKRRVLNKVNNNNNKYKTS